MEVRSLRYFLAVIDEGTFRRAAHSLRITQPPLSREIKRMERELGVDLFDRTRQPVALTAAGQSLEVDARAVLARLESALDGARRAASGRDQITIGFLGAAANGLLPATVRRFRTLYPDAHLVLQEHESGLAQLEHLHDHRIDLGLVREPVAEPALECELIADEPFIAILPSDHRLASSNEPISVSELAGEPFVFWSRENAPNPFDAAMAMFRDRGLDMPIVQEALGVQTVLGLVAAGIGISLLPQSVRALNREGTVTRPLRSPSPTIPLFAVWRTDSDSQPLSNLLTILRNVALGAAGHAHL
jgi:DNA-binding transcriptional LysR family regulator